MTRNPDRDIVEALGDALLEHLEHADPVAGERPAGFSSALPAVLAEGAWGPVPLRAAALELFREPSWPTLVRVPRAALRKTLRGRDLDDGEYATFDSAEGRVLLEVADLGGRASLIDAWQGAIDVWLLADRLAGLDPPAAVPPEPPVPQVRAWSDAAGAAPWLARDAARLASSADPVDRAAGAGMLSRLWERPDPRVAVAASPTGAVRAWARGLAAGQVEALEGAAVARAWTLGERIASVAALPPDLAGEEVRAVVLDRDDLQSVRRVLRLAGAGAALAGALASVDDAAAACLSELADLLPAIEDDLDADRWHAVAWQEPDAWWASLP